jgi:hypothetical protein
MDKDQTETNDLVNEYPEIAKEWISDWEEWIENTNSN